MASFRRGEQNVEMSLLVPARVGAVVAVALGVALAPCAAARAATPTPTPEPTPATTVGPSVPSDDDIAEARRAAAAAAAEVADIEARLEAADARLEVLQRDVAEAVAADETARQQLADAESAVARATEEVATARRERDAADRVLAGSAAQMYMQGGDLEDLTTLVLSPPSVMSDLAFVLDARGHRVQADLDSATTAASRAAALEQQLRAARDDRALAVEQAGAKRAAAEQKAAQAGAEAARLGKQQEVLSARLAVLERGAADLAGLREAAARLGRTDLLGVQAFGSVGSAPRKAQEIARSMVTAEGWDAAEFTCLVGLWQAESGWSWSATNPTSGAYGIPQALPGWKMAAAGSDWLTNPATQIRWGLDYIASVYGSPCKAYDAFLARSPHWY